MRALSPCLLASSLLLLQAPARADPAAPPPAEADAPTRRLLTPEQEGQQDLLHGPAVQPFRDFNLVRSKVPPVLLRALNDPYERAPRDCAALGAQVSALNDALGPDLDEPVDAERGATVTRGQDNARESALSLLSATVTEAIPFHGGVRWITGANRHDRLVMAAITAGAERRAYLKGLGEAQGCPPPSAPRHLAHPSSVAYEPPAGDAQQR